jgi:hypothetical protein
MKIRSEEDTVYPRLRGVLIKKLVLVMPSLQAISNPSLDNVAMRVTNKLRNTIHNL